MRTQQERMVTALERRPYIQKVVGKSAKYAVYKNTTDGKFIYVGSCGALRIGTSLKESFTRPKVKAMLLREVPE